MLVWSPGKGSPIHDHANSHCIAKVLKGSLKETRFDFPSHEHEKLNIIRETMFEEGMVTYMSDDLGLHKISNPDPQNVAVSLHRMSYISTLGRLVAILKDLVYTPPNAAVYGCNIFDEKTGRRSHVSQSNFYSMFGRKV